MTVAWDVVVAEDVGQLGVTVTGLQTKAEVVVVMEDPVLVVMALPEVAVPALPEEVVTALPEVVVTAVVVVMTGPVEAVVMTVPRFTSAILEVGNCKAAI